MIIGFNRTGFFDTRYQRVMVNVSGTIVLNGKVSTGAGSRLEVAKGATLTFDGDVANSAAVSIECQDSIWIGGDTVISWDTMIMDTDFHYVFNIETGKTRPMHKPIRIGKGTWLCAGSKVLKGSVLPDGSILSAGSVLNHAVDVENTLLVGNPAVIVKQNVTRIDIQI